MKTVLSLLALCGVVLYVEGACSVADCTLGSELTGTAGCTTYQTYIDCLGPVKDACTDATAQQVIQTAIDTSTSLKAALSCSGSTTVTCSMLSCTLGSTLTGSAGCTTYDTYIACLGEAKGQCGASDTINEGLIDAAISSNNALKTALQCGGSCLGVSAVSLLLLAALAALLN